MTKVPSIQEMAEREWLDRTAAGLLRMSPRERREAIQASIDLFGDSERYQRLMDHVAAEQARAVAMKMRRYRLPFVGPEKLEG